MPRERKPFAKTEPAFVLGDSKAGRRFLELSDSHQLYYIRLWNLCIKKRIVFIPVFNQNLNKISAEIFISPTKFKKFLAEILDKKLAFGHGENSVYLKGLREIHAKLFFEDGDIMGTEQEPVEGQDWGDDVPRAREESFRDLDIPPSSGSKRESLPCGGRRTDEEIPSPEKTPADSPAVRMLEKFRERWDAILAAFGSLLNRGGIDTPEQLAEVALRLEAQYPERDLKAALMAASHHLETLADPVVENPFGAALHRAGNHQQLRNGTFGKLQAALDGAAPAKPGGQISAAEIVCSLCGKKRIVSRRGDEPVPEICPACELQKAKAQLASEGVTLS